jgi:hypothetical protein
MAEVLANNARHVAKHGPGLSYSIHAATAARCPTGKHILRTGLGGMGAGSMWVGATDEDRADPLWGELPVGRCFLFGEVACKGTE